MFTVKQFNAINACFRNVSPHFSLKKMHVLKLKCDEHVEYSFRSLKLIRNDIKNLMKCSFDSLFAVKHNA